MNTFPMIDDGFNHRRLKDSVKVQAVSFWIDVPRDGFTEVAMKHFQDQQPPQTTGVTLQLAQRNGLL